jgi:hypothetical protein
MNLPTSETKGREISTVAPSRVRPSEETRELTQGVQRCQNAEQMLRWGFEFGEARKI